MRLHAWIFVGCTVLLATLPAAAQWKWKVARGQVVISLSRGVMIWLTGTS